MNMGDHCVFSYKIIFPIFHKDVPLLSPSIKPIYNDKKIDTLYVSCKKI